MTLQDNDQWSLLYEQVHTAGTFINGVSYATSRETIPYFSTNISTTSQWLAVRVESTLMIEGRFGATAYLTTPIAPTLDDTAIIKTVECYINKTHLIPLNEINGISFSIDLKPSRFVKNIKLKIWEWVDR